MKKTLCFILTAVVLSSCSGNLVNLQYENGQLVNKRLGLAYNAAPINYEPTAVGEAYGYYGDMDMTLYEIPGMDKKQWLTQAYVGSTTTLFYSADLTLPTLVEMEPDEIYVCTGENVTMSVVTIDDAETVTAVVTLFENGTAVEWPLVDSIDTYEMKFAGDKYPHMYYNLTYGEFAEGVFLYDRSSKRCVEIGDMLDEWIYNSWGD